MSASLRRVLDGNAFLATQSQRQTSVTSNRPWYSASRWFEMDGRRRGHGRLEKVPSRRCRTRGNITTVRSSLTVAACVNSHGYVDFLRENISNNIGMLKIPGA